MRSLFEEKQRYTQWWLWVIIVVTAVAIVGMFSNAMYVQLVLGRPWGDKPMSDDALLAFSMLMISMMVLMLIIFFTSVLEIAVDKTGLSYRYFPLIRKWKQIERSSIQSFEVREYYLKGYGINRDLQGNRRINVKGNKGIELKLIDGTKLLLGTQRPEEFMHALKKMKNGSGEY